jgi:cytoskeletal protein CcmA (bactofilin family)
MKTVIGTSFVLEGDLDSEGPIAVFGRIRGKRVTAKTVDVHPSGSVEAEIRAETVRVDGEVVGTIVATQRIEISAQARVDGDVRAPRVLIADGAQYRGNVDMS